MSDLLPPRDLSASAFERLAELSPDDRRRLIEQVARKHGLSEERLKALLLRSWKFIGRPKQQPPPGEWTFWFLLAGRGFGKTISVAQWAKDSALERPLRFALVAPTFADVRDTMVEGETGLLSVIPNLALLGQSREYAWNRSHGELTLANGTVFRAYSSETPNRLRGPQFDKAWCEEVSSWKDAHKTPTADNSTWSNVLFSTRLSKNPQYALTSTPKPNLLTRGLVKMPHMHIVRGSSHENRSNLSEIWWDIVIAPLEGTRTGRQEINAELLEEAEGALWTRDGIEAVRVAAAPAFARVVVAVDPNTSNEEASNSAGIVVAGRSPNRAGYVIADRTVVKGGPRAWAAAAVDAYHEHEADRIVAEKNQGGEMVRLTIEAVDSSVPIKLVNASRGKRTRAEPISALYEGQEGWRDNPSLNQPKVFHVGSFPELEDEMCLWTPEFDSPDRMDALVWALTDLMLGAGSGQYRSSVARGRIGTSATERRGLDARDLRR